MALPFEKKDEKKKGLPFEVDRHAMDPMLGPEDNRPLHQRLLDLIPVAGQIAGGLGGGALGGPWGMAAGDVAGGGVGEVLKRGLEREYYPEEHPMEHDLVSDKPTALGLMGRDFVEGGKNSLIGLGISKGVPFAAKGLGKTISGVRMSTMDKYIKDYKRIRQAPEFSTIKANSDAGFKAAQAELDRAQAAVDKAERDVKLAQQHVNNTKNAAGTNFTIERTQAEANLDSKIAARNAAIEAQKQAEARVKIEAGQAADMSTDYRREAEQKQQRAGEQAGRDFNEGQASAQERLNAEKDTAEQTMRQNLSDIENRPGVVETIGGKEVESAMQDLKSKFFTARDRALAKLPKGNVDITWLQKKIREQIEAAHPRGANGQMLEPTNPGVVRALKNWERKYLGYGHEVPPETAKQMIQDWDAMTTWDPNRKTTIDSDIMNRNIKEWRKGMDHRLKFDELGNETEYGKAMKPVAELSEQLNDANERFGNAEKAEKALGTIHGETAGYDRDALVKLGERTGRDFEGKLLEDTADRAILNNPDVPDAIRRIGTDEIDAAQAELEPYKRPNEKFNRQQAARDLHQESVDQARAAEEAARAEYEKLQVQPQLGFVPGPAVLAAQAEEQAARIKHGQFHTPTVDLAKEEAIAKGSQGALKELQAERDRQSMAIVNRDKVKTDLAPALEMSPDVSENKLIRYIQNKDKLDANGQPNRNIEGVKQVEAMNKFAPTENGQNLQQQLNDRAVLMEFEGKSMNGSRNVNMANDIAQEIMPEGMLGKAGKIVAPAFGGALDYGGKALTKRGIDLYLTPGIKQAVDMSLLGARYGIPYYLQDDSK